MRSTVPVILAVLAAATSGHLQAQQSSTACRLLEVAELETALGGKAKGKPSGDKQSVPGAMTVDSCSVTLSGKRMPNPVRISVVTDLPIDGVQGIQSRNMGTAREEQWKTAGARLEQAKVGNAFCILAGRPSVASHTTCSIPRGKGYVEVDVVGAVDELPSMQAVGALAQKAFSRL